MQKILKILSIRIKFSLIFLILAGCAASGDRRATEDVGPVTAYARNTLAEENPAGLLRIGEGFERSGDFIGARKLYAQARAAAPDLLDAHIAYARASGKAGLNDEAAAVLTLLRKQNPGNTQIKTALASVHVAGARYQSALSLLESIEEPTSHELAMMGKIAHALGDGARGQQALASALDLTPDDPQVLEASALSFALNADYASAVGLLRRAMDKLGGNATAQQSLALVYALSGQRQAALRLARDVMPPDEVQRLQSFYTFLPSFTKQEQAAALFFGRVPTDTIARLSGRATN